MSILARYKKPGGFKQLLQLIETSQPVKQEKLLGVIENESPDWANLIREKMISADLVLAWDPNHLVVIFEHMNSQHCVCIFKSLGTDKIKDYSTFFKEEKYRDLKNLIDDDREPSKSEIFAAHNNMLETVRYLDEEKKIDLRYINPRLDLSEAA